MDPSLDPTSKKLAFNFRAIFVSSASDRRESSEKSRTVKHSTKLSDTRRYDRARIPKPGVAGSSSATPASVAKHLAATAHQQQAEPKRLLDPVQVHWGLVPQAMSFTGDQV